MEQRNRSRSTNTTLGDVYSTKSGVIVFQEWSSCVVEQKTVMDFTHKKGRKDGTLPPSDFESDTISRTPATMYRSRAASTFKFNGYAIYTSYIPPRTGYIARTNPARSVENDQLTLILLAKTHPYRPEFSVPVAIRELTDIASLFSLAAKSFLSFAGGAYLNYKFGWLQFVRDVRTLHGITVALERRIRELNSLGKHGGLRRKVDLAIDRFDSYEANRVIQSTYGTTVKANCTWTGEYYRYGSVRWKWTRDNVDLTPLAAFNTAVKKVFDLEEIDPHTMWNMIPFSWLVDYFINIGDYLQIQDGLAQVTPYDICIMRRYRALEVAQPIEPSPSLALTVNGKGIYRRDVKSRDVWYRGDFPLPAVGLLTQDKLLILAALLARFRG